MTAKPIQSAHFAGGWTPILLLCLAALEPFAYFAKMTMAIPLAWIWLFHGVVYFVVTLALIGRRFVGDFLDRQVLVPTCAVLICALPLWGMISDQTHLNGEAAHQVSIGLQGVRDLSFGYSSCGFFCYPARQYSLLALPTALFGPSTAALKFGYLSFLSVGFLVFYVGIRGRVRSAKWAPAFALFSLLGVASCPYVALFAQDPEQAILPLACTLHCIGWFLIFSDTRRPLHAICLAWVGGLLGTSYTPALASWALLIALLAAEILKSIRNKAVEGRSIEGALLFYLCSFGAWSFLSRGDLTLRGDHLGSAALSKLTSRFWEAVVDVFSAAPGYQGFSFGGPVFSALFLFYAIWTLLFARKAVHFLLLSWSFAILASAVGLHGYAPGSVDRMLHRALPLIPVVIVAACLPLSTYVPRLGSRAHFVLNCLNLVMILLVGSVWSSTANFWAAHERERMEMLRNWQEIRIEIPNRREALGVIIASKAFDLNLADYVRYFAPEMSFFEKGLDGCPREHNLPQVQRIEALLDEGTCLAELLGMRDFRLERQKEFTEFFDGYGQRKLVFIELSRLSGSAN